MEITTSTKQHTTIHTLFGRLDYRARQIFTSTIHENCTSETHDIILDLEAVTFIDSSGLGLIHKCITESQAQQVNVTLVNPKDQIYSILELCNMAQFVSSSDEPLSQEQSASATVRHNPHVLTRDALSIID
ncbi:MAG: hypothetical protein NPIRA02_25160 [Nitrospirales bacterium]|nr:MAG: hypothetical protein NPIRA02_25160 [Nitrospirales bacterium]